MDATDGAERTWNLETLRSTADRASDLTRNLLDLRGRSRIEAIDLDVGPFVAGMRGAIEHLIGDNVTLVIDALDQPATVRIDGARLELAVLNLAANARDAMQGGGRLTISLEIAQTSAASGADQLDENGGVLLSVSDTGHGMDAATVAHVFEPYFSTKARGRGTGLGLAAVHGTVVDAGGAIAIESALGAGTTVRIWLPRVARPHLELVTS
jgi:signal transduction histidine kinase